MRSFFALLKKDLKGYFDQATGYILLVIFIGVTSFLYFRTVITTEEASLRPMFDLLPWILAVFVPAATMRLVAEEQRDGTLELLLTQPIRGWTVLLSKFCAGLAFVGVGIVATIGIPLSLQTAGNLDDGAVIAQYLGTFFLTSSFVAIGVFTSSLTRNQIVSFILALTFITSLMLAGLPFITIALPSSAAVLVQDLSPLTHFSGIVRGVLDLRDILYFVAVVSTFMSATYLTLRSKSISHRSPLFRNLQLGVGGLVIISLLVGWFGRDIEGRIDLTENNLYTLSKATGELIDSLDDIVTVKLFASKDPPVQIAISTRNVNDFLDDLEARSNGKVRVVRRFPDESEDAEREAFESYVPPVDFSAQTGSEFTVRQGYLGMGMTYLKNLESIPFVESIDGLEYRVASNIFKMAQSRPKKVAIMIGHGEKRRDAMLQTLRNELERNHEVVEIGEAGAPDLGLSFGGQNPENIDVLIVAGPTEGIPGPTYDEIDEFLANGGKALIMLDPVTVDTTRLRADRNEFSMADYVEQYGVKLTPELVFDVRSNEVLTFAARFGNVSLPYPYWVRVTSVENQVSGGVPGAVLPWAGNIELTGRTALGIQAEIAPLLVTSDAGALDDDYQDISPQSPRVTGVAEEEMASRLVAVAVTGVRCPPYRPRCEPDQDKPFRMIVTADSDWISETMVGQYPENLAMGVNWLDWLTQENALASIRSKGTEIRRLEFSSNTHLSVVQWGNVFGIPGLLVVLGLARLFVRRRTMRKVYQREG